MRFPKLAILAAVAASAAPVLAGSIEDIGSAPDPSAAIQVYVGAPDRSNLDVEHAYVRRMEELGTPELADSQAKDVVARDPKDSVGWATIAESDAKRGKMPEALSAIPISPDYPQMIQSRWARRDASSRGTRISARRCKSMAM
jgi:predicted Zn-dependent protease